jgi:hypothetical protein
MVNTPVLPSPIGRMSLFPNLIGRVSGILSNHEHLKRTLVRLDLVCAALEQGESIPPKELGPADLLASLQRYLVEHFAAEESREYFGAVLTEAPRLSRAIAALTAEHLTILRTLEMVYEMALEPTRWHYLPSPLRRLLKDIERHEATETKVLHELFRAPAVPA